MQLILRFFCIALLVGMAMVLAQDTTTTMAPTEPADASPTSTVANAITEEPTTAPTDIGNATSDSSTTESSNSTDTADETDTSTTPSSAATTSPPNTPKGVSADCLDLYHSCINQYAADSMTAKKYCDALQAAETCIQDGNDTSGNTTKECTPLEQERLDLLDCGPVTLFKNSTVSEACLARISECLSTAQDLSKLTKDYTFSKFFCDSAENSKSCFTSEEDGSKCTSGEHGDLLKAAGCNSARALIGSTLLIAFMYLMQRIVGEN